MLANSLINHLRTLAVVDESEFPLRVGKIEAKTVRAVMAMLPLGGFEQTLDTGAAFRGQQQFIVRSPDPEELENVCNAIRTALHVEGSPRQIEGHLIKQMISRRLPVVYPRNDADLYEGSILFECYVIRQ